MVSRFKTFIALIILSATLDATADQAESKDKTMKNLEYAFSGECQE